MDHVTKHPSIWLETSALPTYPALAGDLHVDVCIVGGGITGLTAARLLKRAGMTVAVVEGLTIGGGDSSNTTAHLAAHHDLYYEDTISKFGDDDARLVLESRRAAIAQIESFVTEDGIDCHYERVPAYLFAEDASGAAQLRREITACERLGMNVEWVEDMPVRFPVMGAIRFANQAQFHPLEYMRALAERIPGNGSHVFEHTRAIDFDDGVVKTANGEIRCKHVLLAANAPIGKGLIITRVAAYRTYAMAFRIDSAEAPNALLWDTLDPYHYVRMHRSGDAVFLIVGGEDHKVGASDEGDSAWRRLEAWTRGRFSVGQVVTEWSGQILEPADGLPYIGKLSSGVWIATGYSGDGMTNGTLAAMILAQEIAGERTAASRIYDPTRLDVMASAKEFVRENVDYPVHLLTDRLRRPAGDRLRVVGPGEGKIVRVGREKLAVYREPSGMVHAFSPVCTHMGCHVHWNSSEESWDCPCHGSRFDPRTGAPLNGPATKALEARDVSDRASAVPPEVDRASRPSFA